MKDVREMTAQPAISEMVFRMLKEGQFLNHFERLKEFFLVRPYRLRQLLISGVAVLFLTLLFLAGSYLFFTQLATFGW